MNAVDTNVLVRFFVRDDEDQYQKAKELFQSATFYSPIFINLVVLIEWVWVLTDYYKIDKDTIVTQILKMTESTEVELENDILVKRSLQIFKHSNADFADCLICEINAESGHAPTYTFDKKASKLKGMKLLK